MSMRRIMELGMSLRFLKEKDFSLLETMKAALTKNNKTLASLKDDDELIELILKEAESGRPGAKSLPRYNRAAAIKAIKDKKNNPGNGGSQGQGGGQGGGKPN